VVFFRKWLNQYVEIVKCVADCMIWFKFDKCIMPIEILHVHILITLSTLDSFSVDFSSHSTAS
jgi:REP element-mobilizing transposase RayT